MKIGRKGTILLGCLLICIGALLQAATYSVGQVCVGDGQRCVRRLSLVRSLLGASLLVLVLDA